MVNPLDLVYSFKTGDKGLGALFRVLRNAGGRVKVGVIGTKAGAPKRVRPGPNGTTTSPATLAQVAAVHEFGLGVKKRSFIRGWVDANQASIIKDIKKAVSLISIGRVTPEQALKILGVKWVAEVQEFIATSSNFAPLDPATIARKGSAAPLIDTGQLRSSISYELVK